ncbi:MAG TPA: serine hydrolase [Solirubrobacteraceae bacterium]|jgi:hypothetical protein|nr:serine hydrolase [Solirubrobacteraceae bacterium]
MRALGAPVALVAASGAIALLPGAADARAPVLYTQKGVAAARAFARSRQGVVSFAVLDPEGHVSGLAVRTQHRSASVSKAMLLVAALRRAAHRRLTSAEKALLRPMITQSDNDAASAVYEMVGGDAALLRVAALAHMNHFEAAGFWSEARLTAIDQARLFLHMASLLPERHRPYGMGLLKSIVPDQSWGIAAVARRHRMRAYFKGGWRPGAMAHGQWRPAIASQIALLRRGHRRIAVAVLTTGSPSVEYGERTIAGIAQRVLG